jgi:hypothetical protein
MLRSSPVATGINAHASSTSSSPRPCLFNHAISLPFNSFKLAGQSLRCAENGGEFGDSLEAVTNIESTALMHDLLLLPAVFHSQEER